MKINKKYAAVTSVTAAVSSEAAVVQITQTNNSLLLTSSTPSTGDFTVADNLSADLTGDGVDDISITDVGLWNTTSGPTSSPNQGTSWLGMRINGSRNLAGVGRSFVTLRSTYCVTTGATDTTYKFFQAGEITCYGATASTSTNYLCGIVRLSTQFSYGFDFGGVADADPFSSSSCGTIPISFNDPFYGEVEGWLHVSQRNGQGITLERVIFDSENPGVRPDVDCRDPAFAEASEVVPEPSSIALLALGAGGVLLRRQRKAAA